jgi:hypothetical protein
MFGENFAGSIGANALLAVAYACWKIFDRCQRSKCKMDGEKGLTFDLGDPNDTCPATDMARLGELLKQRSMHHVKRLKARSPPAGPPPRVSV